jgi:hypothetical protein
MSTGVSCLDGVDFFSHLSVAFISFPFKAKSLKGKSTLEMVGHLMLVFTRCVFEMYMQSKFSLIAIWS